MQEEKVLIFAIHCLVATIGLLKLNAPNFLADGSLAVVQIIHIL